MRLEQEMLVQIGFAIDMIFHSEFIAGLLRLVVSSAEWCINLKDRQSLRNDGFRYALPAHFFSRRSDSPFCSLFIRLVLLMVSFGYLNVHSSPVPNPNTSFVLRSVFLPDEQPVITSQPADQMDCVGHIVSFHVVAAGSGLAYIWQRKKPVEGSFTDIPAESNVSYPSPGILRLQNGGNTGSPDGTQYRVVVWNSTGSVTSDAATLTINEITDVLPSVSIPLKTNVIRCDSSNFSYRVTTSYPSNVVSYQWKKWVSTGIWADVPDGGAISGATTDQLVFTGATPSESGEYKVTVVFHSSGADCNVTSDTRTRKLTILPELMAPEVTGNQMVCHNETAAPLTAAAAAGGSGSGCTYQWQSSPDGNAWTNVPGATGLSYSPVILTETTSFRLLATDPFCGSVISNPATKTILLQTLPPAVCCDQFICPGNEVAPLAAQAATGGSGSFTYQWQVSADGNTGWTDVADVTSLNFNPPDQSRYYRIISTDTACGTTANSTSLQITVASDSNSSFENNGNPSAPVCSGSGFTNTITSVSFAGIPGKKIRYTYTADAMYVSPATGGPSGYDNTSFFTADLPFTVTNQTDSQVHTIIWITPEVYDSPGPPDGSIYCSFNPIPINLTINPFRIICPADSSVSTSAGNCLADVTTPDPVFSGDCIAADLSWTLTGATLAGSTGTGIQSIGSRSLNTGTTLATYTATNSYGVSATCSFSVELTDTEKPVIFCPEAPPAICAGNSGTYIHSGTDWDAIATDNCSALTPLTFTLSGSTTGAGSSLSGVVFNTGATQVLWQVSDSAGNSETCSYSVVINPLPITETIYHN